MYGRAIQCEQCGKIEFVSPELQEDELLKKGWIRVTMYPLESPLVAKHNDFCGWECSRAFMDAQAK